MGVHVLPGYSNPATEPGAQYWGTGRVFVLWLPNLYTGYHCGRLCDADDIHDTVDAATESANIAVQNNTRGHSQYGEYI